jgi:hypothetical protein
LEGRGEDAATLCDVMVNVLTVSMSVFTEGKLMDEYRPYLGCCSRGAPGARSPKVLE